MARSIYATFTTERDAERATGALLDHGVSAEDVSFVISDPILHPTVFHPDSSAAKPTGAPPAPVDAVPPAATPLPGTYVASPSVASPGPPYAEDGRLSATNPAISPVSDGSSAIRATYVQPPQPAPHVNATSLAPNTPQEIVDHERRPHIIDMESDRTQAADGFSTT